MNILKKVHKEGAFMTMKNITKLKIEKPANEIFEAIVNPIKIGNFWFSSSSERWEQGKTITIRYDEYNAEGQIEIVEIRNKQENCIPRL